MTTLFCPQALALAKDYSQGFLQSLKANKITKHASLVE